MPARALVFRRRARHTLILACFLVIGMVFMEIILRPPGYGSARLTTFKRRRPGWEGVSLDCPSAPSFVPIESWEQWARSEERLHCSNAMPLIQDNGTRATLPLFIILGEQKCGTTFLRTMLDQHPDLHAGTGIYGREGGETHFFDWTMRVRAIPRVPDVMMAAYADYFPVTKEQFGFDTSPSYFTWPGDIPQRVKQVIPLAKMIVLVRNPVERYESAMRMALCRSKAVQEAEPFHEDGAMADYLAARQQHRTLHVSRGIYKENLDRWLSVFDRSQLLVIESGELYRDPEGAMRKVLHYLGLPPFHPDVHMALREGQNKGCAEDYRLAEADREVLANFYRPHNIQLEQFLGRKLGWH